MLAFAAFLPAIAEVRLDRTEVKPGGTIWATYTFVNLGDSPSSEPLTVFVHPRLLGRPEGTYPMFGADFRPLLPTTLWRKGEAVVERRPIRVPPRAPEGEYRLLLGLYNPRTGERVKMANDAVRFDDLRYEVARFKVTKSPGPPRPFVKRFEGVPRPEAGRPAVKGRASFTISNGRIEATLDKEAPIVHRIKDLKTGEEFLGSPHAFAPEVVVCDKKGGWRYLSTLWRSVEAEWRLTERGKDFAVYRGAVAVEGREAASLDVRLSLDGDSLLISFGSVEERRGFDLMEVFLREVASVPEVEGGTLLLPTDCGREVPAREAGPSGREFGLSWFDPFLYAALYRERGKALLLLRPLGVEDRIFAWITPPFKGLGKCASLGVRLVHRLRARPPAAQFVAQKASGARLTVVRDLDGDGAANWVDAAKFIRRRYRGLKPNPLYVKATVYKIMCDVRPHRLVTTFEECLGIIRKIHNLTAGAVGQVVYLVGWQHDGHDTGYPDVSVVNPRLGGYKALMRLKEEAKRFGAIVSFHDNYDDAYMDSPAWDPSIIAIDPNGNLTKGGVWAGGQSYIISPAKYLPKALERARFTVKRYKIERTYHIDVLSAVPMRHDFDPRSPHGAEDAIRAKLAVVREFNKFGVDVTSEGVTEPFVGPMTRIRHLVRRGVEHFVGERRVPFVPFIIHGHIIYGGGQAGYGGLLGALINGQTYSADFTKATPDSGILDLIYLYDLPAKKLALREMERYERRGRVERVWYGPDTFVEVDWAHDRYRVVVDGREIARNYATFVEVKPGLLLAYSRDGGRLMFELPPSLQGAEIEVVPLYADGEGRPVPFLLEGAKVSFEAEPRRPYAIRKRRPKARG